MTYQLDHSTQISNNFWKLMELMLWNKKSTVFRLPIEQYLTILKIDSIFELIGLIRVFWYVTRLYLTHYFKERSSSMNRFVCVYVCMSVTLFWKHYILLLLHFTYILIKYKSFKLKLRIFSFFRISSLFLNQLYLSLWLSFYPCTVIYEIINYRI